MYSFEKRGVGRPTKPPCPLATGLISHCMKLHTILHILYGYRNCGSVQSFTTLKFKLHLFTMHLLFSFSPPLHKSLERENTLAYHAELPCHLSGIHSLMLVACLVHQSHSITLPTLKYFCIKGLFSLKSPENVLLAISASFE